MKARGRCLYKGFVLPFKRNRKAIFGKVFELRQLLEETDRLHRLLGKCVCVLHCVQHCD